MQESKMDLDRPNCTNYALPGKRHSDFHWRCTNWHLPYIWIHEYSSSKFKPQTCQMSMKTQSNQKQESVHIHVHALKMTMKGTTVWTCGACSVKHVWCISGIHSRSSLMELCARYFSKHCEESIYRMTF